MTPTKYIEGPGSVTHGINVKSVVVAAVAVLATLAMGAVENTNVSAVVDPKGDKPLPAISGAPRDSRKPFEIFVSSQSGQDGNDGSSADKALKNVHAALLLSVPGSTITLLPGWYDENIILKAGAKDRPIALRAARPGRVFLGRPAIVSDLQKVEGKEYTYVAAFPEKLNSLTEMDTGRVLRYLATPEDVEELAGTFCQDEKLKKLYIHPSDSAGVSHHTYSITRPGTGITLADYTLVDGITLSGFGDAAIRGSNPTGAIVQNCILYGNGYGIQFNGGKDCVIRGNEAWGNMSGYNEGAQIFFGCDPVISGFLVESNRAYHSSRIGIRFYSGAARNCMTRNNLIYGNSYGFWYKVNNRSEIVDGKTSLVAEGNVSFGNPNGDMGAPLMRNNTYGRYVEMELAPKKGDSDLVRNDMSSDCKFADPAHHDYRLQKDSPARGKAPDGKDLGAFQFDGSVVFVRHAGADRGEATCLTEAWKTPGYAGRNLNAGQTLYIEGGKWNEPLVIKGLKATAARPTTIRIHGKAQAWFPSVRLEDCAHLKLEGIRVEGAPEEGLLVIGCKEIALLRCASSGNKGAGITLANSSAVQVDGCALARNGRAGLRIMADCSDVELTSSMLFGNKITQMELIGKINDFYSNMNAFGPAGEGIPLAKVAAESAIDLEAWRKLSNLDGNSLVCDPRMLEKDRGDFRVVSGSAASIAGRYSRPVGPDGAVSAEKIIRKRVERVEVISTTPSSANITFWTPGKICGTLVEWGATTNYGDIYDRGDELRGEFETFHTVSLLGLKAGASYHFRVGWRDYWAPQEENVDNKDPIRWSEDHTFTTAAKDPEPRRLYVALEGDDQNDGLGSKTAWRTLRQAARQARAGDTVTILPGRYFEPLRPLQTGTAEDRRIVFRAEKPLTVFLDGGLINKVRDGRSHCIQVDSKAYLTIENLVCERCPQYDNGGYKAGYGYAGLVRTSGSAMIALNGVVMDSRYRWMTGMVAWEAGRMPGLKDPVYGIKLSDSITLGCWKSFMGSGIELSNGQPAIIWDHCLSYIVRICTLECLGGSRSMKIRNTVFHDRSEQKRQGADLYREDNYGNYDADYNAYCWMPGARAVYAWPKDGKVEDACIGLKAWQDHSKLDAHSMEIMMTKETGVYPATHRLDYEQAGKSLPPLTIADFILPKDAPLIGKGDNGSNLGPRWEKWLK